MYICFLENFLFMPNGKLLKPSADNSLKTINELKLKLDELERQNKAYSDALERFKTIADSSHSWEVLQSPSGELLYLSPACERITGYPVKAFLEDPDLLLKIIHPDDVGDYLTHHLHSRKQKPGHVRFRIICPDGETKYIDHTCKPLYDTDGSFIGTRGSNHETDKSIFPDQMLTDHEKKYKEIQSAQEAMKREAISHSQDLELKIRDRIVEIVQLSNLNQAIVNSLGLALITVSQDGIVTGFNREAETLLGYKADEIIDKAEVVRFHKMEELLRVADELSVASGHRVMPDFELFRVLCEQSSGKPMEWSYVRKNGSEVPVLLTLSYLRDQDGTVTGFLGVAFDNSVRKETEELLRWKEHLLRLMSDSSPYGFLVTDRISGRILYYNHKFCQIWNFLSCEEKMMNGEMNYDAIVSALRRMIKGGAPIAALETNMAEHDENEVLRDEVQLYDGRSVGIFLTQISSEFGEYHGHFYIFEDITERKLTEKTLQLQNAAFESVALGVLISDIRGYIMWVNPAFTKLTGYPVEEAIGRHTRMLKSGKMSKEFYNNLWETILAGNVWTGEFINRRKDGTIYYEVETITPILNDKGEVSRFISVKIDITNRIEMESALRVSEARWQVALEGSGYGIWDYNLITEEIFYSSKWKEMLGYSDDEIPNKFNEWPERVHPDDLKRFYDALGSHLSGAAEFYTSEYRMRCKDGSYKWILDRGKVIEWVGKNKPSRLIGTHTDIDERIRLETSLKESIEKEKELNEMKSRFVSTASHEFRTPLSSILITSDSLLTYWERMEPLQIRDKLTKINNQVLHLTKIVNDVLQLSKIEEGKVEFNPVDIDIIDLCKQVIDSFNSDPKLHFKVAFATPFSSLIMKLDSRLIFQVINNLVSNGIKYSPENPNIKVEVIRKNNELCITVTDNGIGIPEQDQKHLFKPFYRASNTTMIQGNGLGLSIVKESVMLHGGKIAFKSRVGQGTSFYITFPDKLVKSYE
jgi:PAS domain S-box-containing protein